ncbi:MAG TPA: DUF6088 family protein [Candidatus Dormibacteraeota bacterium]
MKVGIPKEILKTVAALPEGTPVSAKELLHLGQRGAVDQALSRLVRTGRLIRASRGTYVCPVPGRFGPRMPSVAELVGKLAERRGETVTEHGAAAANSLGFTEQVPIREIFLTSGRSRRLKVGGQTVELRHAPSWQLVLPGRPAGRALRALGWLGPARAEEALPRLKKQLLPSEVAAMIAARSQVPTWMARQLSELMAA